MRPSDFRRIARAFDGVVEGAHMGQADFRVGGRIFATLAHEAKGFGNLMLNADEQAILVEELPEVFTPIPGGWGRMGGTHVLLKAVDEDVLTGALHTAYKLRVAKNGRAARKKPMKR